MTQEQKNVVSGHHRVWCVNQRPETRDQRPDSATTHDPRPRQAWQRRNDVPASEPLSRLSLSTSAWPNQSLYSSISPFDSLPPSIVSRMRVENCSRSLEYNACAVLYSLVPSPFYPFRETMYSHENRTVGSGTEKQNQQAI